ncbi:MAG: hypothetical protein AAF290_15980 [Pseudomonadota bacterium]
MAFLMKKESDAARITASGKSVVDPALLLQSEKVQSDLKIIRQLFESSLERAKNAEQTLPVSVSSPTIDEEAVDDQDGAEATIW